MNTSEGKWKSVEEGKQGKAVTSAARGMRTAHRCAGCYQNPGKKIN